MYWIVAAVVGIWVAVDAGRRKDLLFGVLWGGLTFILLPLAIPIYFAVRPLKAGEVRTGGIAWNILKNFAIARTALMAVILVVTIVWVGELAERVPTGLGRAQLVMRSAAGLARLIAIWLVPVVAALLVGFFLRNSTSELGPSRQASNHSIS